MNKAVAKTAQTGSDQMDPPSQVDPDLVGLSKRMTQRAAASLVTRAPSTELGQLSLEAEAAHVEALRRYITSKEAIVARFRDQLARFPQDIATLRDRMRKDTDTKSKLIISKNLEAYVAMEQTLKQRVADFDASWPERKAEIQAAIEDHEARRDAAQ